MDFARIALALLLGTLFLRAEEQVLINPPPETAETPTPEADEPEEPTEEELEEQANTGYLRCWVLLSDETLPLAVRITQPGIEEPLPLFEGTPTKPARGGYQLLKKGPARIQIDRGGEPWKTVEFQVEPQTYQTLLFMENGATPKGELLPDRPPLELGHQSQLRIFNVASNRTAILEIDETTRLEIPPETYATHYLTARENIPVRIVVPNEDGYPAISHSEISTTSAKSWSILIAPDYRGRFRPRTSPDQLQ